MANLLSARNKVIILNILLNVLVSDYIVFGKDLKQVWVDYNENNPTTTKLNLTQYEGKDICSSCDQIKSNMEKTFDCALRSECVDDKSSSAPLNLKVCWLRQKMKNHFYSTSKITMFEMQVWIDQMGKAKARYSYPYDAPDD